MSILLRSLFFVMSVCSGVAVVQSDFNPWHSNPRNISSIKVSEESTSKGASSTEGSQSNYIDQAATVSIVEQKLQAPQNLPQADSSLQNAERVKTLRIGQVNLQTNLQATQLSLNSHSTSLSVTVSGAAALAQYPADTTFESPTTTVVSRFNDLTVLKNNLSVGPTSQLLALGGNGAERGGGDMVAIVFRAYGQAFLKDLHLLHQKGKFLQVSETAVANAISDYKINVFNKPILDSAGVPRDAVTDTATKTIELNRQRWETDSNNAVRAMITVHEYLRASGYSSEDDLYGWSQQIIAQLMSFSVTSFLLNVGSDQIDGVLLQKAFARRQIYCEDTEAAALKMSLTHYGIQIYAPLFDVAHPNFSELDRSLTQISYGRLVSTIVVKTTTGSLIVTIQMPDLSVSPFFTVATQGLYDPNSSRALNLEKLHQYKCNFGSMVRHN